MRAVALYPQLRDDLSIGRGIAIHHADRKIAAWEAARAEQEARAAEEAGRNAHETAQDGAQAASDRAQDETLAQRGKDAQNGAETARGKSAQNQGEVALPPGYRTESGRPLSEADPKEFIIKPNGSKNFGEIPKEIEEATGGKVKSAPVRLRVGHNGVGYIHLLKHAPQMQQKGYGVMDYINHILQNFNQVYSQQTSEKKDRFVLYCKGDDSKGFMPIDLELEQAGENYYVIVSAMPHHPKIKGTLLFDGNATPSAVTTDSTLSRETNKNGGDGSRIAYGKNNDPSSISTIPSEAEESKEKPLNEGEREAVKGLSADAKQVYQLVRDKLSGMKNKAVQRAASVSAVLLARHADIIARKVRAALGKPFTAMDYFNAWFALQYGGEADGLRQAANAGVNLDEQVPVVDITQSVPFGKPDKKKLLSFVRNLIQKNDSTMTADGLAAIGVLKKDDAHITYSSMKTGNMRTNIRIAAIHSIKDLIQNAVLIESVPNRKRGKKPKVRAYHRFYVPVQVNQDIWTIRLVAEEQEGIITLNPTEVNLYDVILDKKSTAVPTGTKPVMGARGASGKTSRTPAGISPVMGSAGSLTTISIRDMLTGVKDADGNVYAQRAWHGSRYDFAKFILSMIGEGEGTQVHGWGIYVAKLRDIAEKYRKYVSRPREADTFYDGTAYRAMSGEMKESIRLVMEEVRASWKKNPTQYYLDGAIKKQEEHVQELKDRLAEKGEAGAYLHDIIAKEQRVLDILKEMNPDKLDLGFTEGQLYEVEIPEDDVLIDEQKPFDKQSEFVKKKLEELFAESERVAVLRKLARDDHSLFILQRTQENIKEHERMLEDLQEVIYGNLTERDRSDVLDSLAEDGVVDLNVIDSLAPEEVEAYLKKQHRALEENIQWQKEAYEQEYARTIGTESLAHKLLGGLKNGKKIYENIRLVFPDGIATHEQISRKLNEYGIKGITYDGEKDGRCFVIFDDAAIEIVDKLYKDLQEVIKGTTTDAVDGQRIISLFESADESTMLHEMGHLFLMDLERLAPMSPTSAQDLATVKKWAAWSEGQLAEYEGTPFAPEFAALDKKIRAALKSGNEKAAERLKRQWEHERFARGFERYLMYGDAPTKTLRGVFAKFRAFLQRVYQAFTGAGGRATPEVEEVMARMISIEDKSDLTAYPRGKETKVYTDSGKALPVQYRVVSADDLIASHMADDMTVNPGYPQALQPRDRERVMMRQQVDRMASTLRPEDLGEGRNLNQGAPVIRSDGVVLNGNGRVIAIRRAQEGERGAAYRDYLMENAETFGLKKEDVAGVENPVLVREVQGDVSADMMQDIIGSTTGGSRMGASENAQHDAGKITYGMMDAYVPNDKGDITSAANRSFVAGILHKVTGSSERNAYLDKDGHVNADGIQRVKRALFALAYGDDELIAKMSESTDDDIRNVSNGLMTAAPMMARLPVKQGVPHVKELQDAIGDAVKQLDILRASGESVKDYLGAQSMFSEYEDSDEMRLILDFLDENKRSGKRIATFFSRVAQTLDGMETKSANDLFETEQPSLMDVLEGAKAYAENGGQEGLFGGEQGVVVRGDEFGAYSDIKELRKKAIQYYKEHLQGTSVENAQLGKVDIDSTGLVEFTGSGKREVKSTSAKEEKLLLVKYLPQLIRDATNITENAPQKERHATDYFYYLHTSAEIDGKTIPVDITLVKRNDGSIQFFNHVLPTLEKDNKNELPVSARPESSKEALGTSPVGSSSTSNISPNEAEGKAKEPTLEEILRHDPGLKKSALEYGAREKDGKVVFADKAQEKDFLRVANALISDVLAKFSVAWHGSPFYFDSFSLSAINSGEGAQAHGWGLYFAKSREVAEGYRRDLSGNEDIILYYGERYENTNVGWMITDGNEAGGTIPYDDPLAKVFDVMSANHGDVAEALKDLESELNDQKEWLEDEEEFENDEEYVLLRDAVDILRDDSDGIVVGDPGRLFEVEIPDEDVMLDEDLGYDEQPPKVKSALKKLVEHIDSEGWEDYHRARIRGILEADSGRYIYDEIHDIVGTAEDASKLLNRFGIEGISYDGQRDGRCYVVFDDNAIEVLETYSARRQEGIRKMLAEIRLVSPKQLTARQKAVFGWGKEMGVPVVFFKGDPGLHGFHSGGVTFLNADSEITPQWTFWHEAMHWMKANNPDIYNDLVRAVSGAEGFTKEQLDAYRKEIGAPQMSDADVIEEMLADALPDVKRRVPLLRDIGKRDTNVIQRFVAWVHDVMRRFHDHFYTPKGGLTTAQRRAMVGAFGNLVGSIRDADGKQIFRVQNEGARITLRDGGRLPAVKYSLDNTGKEGDNESRISEAVFQKYLNDGIMKMVRDRVSDEIGAHIDPAAMRDPVARDAARDRLPYIRQMLVWYNQSTIQENPAYKNRMAAKIEYARRCFDNDPRIQHGAVRPSDRDNGQGGIHQNRNAAVPGNDKGRGGSDNGRSPRGVSRSISGERAGAHAHFEQLYEDMRKHLEDQGAFSTPKFSANTNGQSRTGNFKWLTGAIRKLVGVAPADNLELPGRPKRTVTLTPEELERRIKGRWIQETNIISKEAQKDGQVKVTFYPDTHDVGYADWVKSVRQVAKRNPFVKVLYDLAHKAMKKQEHLRNDFGKTLKEFSNLVKSAQDMNRCAEMKI